MSGVQWYAMFYFYYCVLCCCFVFVVLFLSLTVLPTVSLSDKYCKLLAPTLCRVLYIVVLFVTCCKLSASLRTNVNSSYLGI